MQILKAFFAWLVSEPFIVATGIAAWAHSTWTFAISFSGELPPIAKPLAWLTTMIPAALLAFAIDVGQIRTANDIRKGERNKAKVLTFAVLAIATAYLQWFYMVAHVPALALGAGIRPEWEETITLMRDASVFIIPLLLPIATVLYTVSNSDAQPDTQKRKKKIAKAHAPKRKTQSQNGATAPASEQDANGKWPAECDVCNWHKRYDTERGAKNAHSAHCRSKSHQSNAVQAQPAMTANGNH